MKNSKPRPSTTQQFFSSMKKRLKTNPGHGYAHESSPGTGMGAGSSARGGMGARTAAPRTTR